MVSGKFEQKINYIIITIFGLTTAGLIYAQIDTANTATKLESTLFNILQFIFSLGFAWVLSKVVTFLNFQETQKQFAIGAFRRIKEIERSLNRIQVYIESAEGNSASNLDVIRASLAHAQDSVNSSIADWSDIIGDEIEISKEIDRLNNEKKDLDVSTQISDWPNDNLPEKIEKIDQKIKNLKSKLSAELRTIKEFDIDTNKEKENLRELLAEFEATNRITFRCFWEKGDMFGTDLANVKIGDAIYIARGLTFSRNGVLIAYNKDGLSLGVITNKFTINSSTYDEFMSTVRRYFNNPLLPKNFGGDPIPGEIYKMQAPPTGTAKRHNFEIMVRIPPSELAKNVLH